MPRLNTLLAALVLFAGTVGTALPALAGVVATIDLSAQRMYVSVNGKPTYAWPVSTGRRGYVTPIGSFRPGRMHVEYYSRKYDMSPMPYSIFFYGGYAIHGTYATKALGRPASHGCVRLHPANAKQLFYLVKKHGRGNTRIRVRR